MKAKAKKDKQKENDEKKAKKTAVAKYLDPKRGQDLGIFIKSNKLDICEVENAIYNFDNSVVDFEVLRDLRKKSATSGELELLKSHMQSQPDVPLDNPEQFLLDLSGISHFDERLQCVMFQGRLTEGMSDIEYRLNNVSHVCDQLLNSSNTKQVREEALPQCHFKFSSHSFILALRGFVVPCSDVTPLYRVRRHLSVYFCCL